MSKEYINEQDAAYAIKLKELLSLLPNYVEQYIDDKTYTLTPKTKIAYINDIKQFFEYLKTSNPLLKECEIKQISAEILNQINASDITEYLKSCQIYEKGKTGKKQFSSASNINRKLSSLRSFFLYLHKHEYIENNPTVLIESPKLREKPIIRLEADEVVKFLDSVEYGNNLTKRQMELHGNSKERDLAIITLLLGTGIRVSECVGIDIKDIDFEESRILITRKGRKEQYVYFGSEVEKCLLVYMEVRKQIETILGHEEAFFLSNQRKRISVRSIENLVKKYSEGVIFSKKISPHKLRSTYGTELYRETGDIYLCAEALGHKSVETARRHYVVSDEEKLRNSRNMVKLRDTN